MYSKARLCTMLSMALLLMISFSLPVRGNSEGIRQAINMVEITIEEDSIPIDISVNGTSEGRLHCTATLLLKQGIIIDSVDVFLEVTFPNEISVGLDDYEFTLSPEDPVLDFEANVTVEPMTSSTLTPEITIDGYCIAQPTSTRGGISEDTAIVNILPFYTAEISIMENTVTVDKGKSADLTLTMENRGNADETFVLNWANENELSSRDISVEFQEKNVFLEEGETRELTLTVKTGDRSDRGSYLIRIEVWSEKKGPANKEESMATVIIDVNNPLVGSLEDFFSIAPSILYITAGGIVVLLLAGIYLFLRFRAKRAWKRRLRDYYRSREFDETTGDVPESRDDPEGS